jgi:predicted enzyme related to lactoylglutathione lyase
LHDVLVAKWQKVSLRSDSFIMISKSRKTLSNSLRVLNRVVRGSALNFRYLRSSTTAASMNTKEPGSVDEHRSSESASSTNAVQVEGKTYEMPPQDGFSVAHFLTVADIDRSARYYETVFGGRILSSGDSSGAPAYIQIANTWLLVNVGGGPTPDKPTVTLSVPDPGRINSFMNIRVADIQACYELWKSRGAEFITEPIPKYGEIRCYIRDPDGYIIEVGQSTDLTYG